MIETTLLFTFYYRLPFLAYISMVLLYIGALFNFVRHMTKLEADLKAQPSLRSHDVRALLQLPSILFTPYPNAYCYICY
jgi:hypothetical protein